MAQEIINGKVIGKRIVNTIGKLIHFNNIGTNLVSDNVEDAVKEINDTCVHLASNVTYVDPLPIDADILGGEYKAENITALVGESYDATKMYTAGETFVYKAKRYKVLNNCSGITPPNTTYYEETSINNDLANKNIVNEYILEAKNIGVNSDTNWDISEYITKEGYQLENVDISFYNLPAYSTFVVANRVANKIYAHNFASGAVSGLIPKITVSFIKNN